MYWSIEALDKTESSKWKPVLELDTLSLPGIVADPLENAYLRTGATFAPRSDGLYVNGLSQ